MARNKVRKGSVLRDIMTGGRFGGVAQVAPTPVDSTSGAGGVGGPATSTGVATAIARSVQQIPFDDSIDGTYPLECFFQMPDRVVQINDIKVWVQRKPFRRYIQAASSSAAGGGALQTSSSDAGHTHTITTSIGQTDASGLNTSGSGALTSDGGAAHTTDSQGVHTHLESGGGTTGSAGSHSHNVNGHTHGIVSHQHANPTHSHAYQYPATGASSGGGHAHSLDTTHSHVVTTTVTPGIFEEALSGTVSLYVADNGIAYGGAVVTGVSEVSGLSIRTNVSKTKGDKRIRINGTALMRVQVLVVMDLILELGV